MIEERFTLACHMGDRLIAKSRFKPTTTVDASPFERTCAMGPWIEIQGGMAM